MKGRMMTKRLRGMLVAGGALLLGTGLAGCSNDAPDTAPIENSAFDEDSAPPAEPNAEASFEPAPAVIDEPSANAAIVEELPPPPPVAPDQQVLDDASATGMTSRSTRADPAEDDAPADDTTANQQGE